MLCGEGLESFVVHIYGEEGALYWPAFKLRSIRLQKTGKGRLGARVSQTVELVASTKILASDLSLKLAP
jgi:hypothetical protein